MGSFSLVHGAVLGIAAMLLFGSSRVARAMGDVGAGVRALRRGLADDDMADRITAGRE